MVIKLSLRPSIHVEPLLILIIIEILLTSSIRVMRVAFQDLLRTFSRSAALCSLRFLMSFHKPFTSKGRSSTRLFAFATRLSFSHSELSVPQRDSLKALQVARHMAMAGFPLSSSSSERISPPCARMAPSTYSFWNSQAHLAVSGQCLLDTFLVL